MKKTIRIEARDFALFLKENLDDLIEQSNTNAMEELGTVFNTEIQSLSSGKYGYFGMKRRTATTDFGSRQHQWQLRQFVRFLACGIVRIF